MYDPTIDMLQGKIITCYEDSCEQLTDTWETLAQIAVHDRKYHTSAVTPSGLLLVGGSVSPITTELVSVDGGQSVQSFSLERPGWKDHCSIQINATTMVLSGGQGTESLTTEYSDLGSGAEVATRRLANLVTGRTHHACGAFLNQESFMVNIRYKYF